MEDDNDD